MLIAHPNLPGDSLYGAERPSTLLIAVHNVLARLPVRRSFALRLGAGGANLRRSGTGGIEARFLGDYKAPDGRRG